MESFSERLNKALKATQVSAAELAKRIGVDEGTISNYRKGRYVPKQNRTREIADCLNVSVAYLLGFDAEMFPKKKEPSSDDSISIEQQELIEIVKKLNPDDVHEILYLLKTRLP